MIKCLLNRFSFETDGYVTVEAMILLPAQLLIFCACWVDFDVMRQQTINQKANHTIGDALSREADPIDDRYIDNARNLLYTLNKSADNQSDLRIILVEQRKNGSYDLVWSEARGDYPPLTKSDLTAYENRMPIMAANDQVVLVETWDWYDPIFPVGLAAFDIQTYSFTRPRFAPQLLHWEHMGQNNGWGNGDQIAPGGSECTNNAENWDSCTNDDGTENREKKNRGVSGGSHNDA